MNLHRLLLPYLLTASMLLVVCNTPIQAADVHRLEREIDQLQKEGKLQEALPLVKQLADELGSKKDGESSDYARVLVDLGSIQMALQDLPAAEESLRRAATILGRITRPNDRKGQIVLAQARSVLGTLLVQKGDLTEARSEMESALKIQTALLEPEHEDIGVTLMGLGMVSFQLGQRADAREQLARALDILQRKLGADDPRVAFIRALNGLLLIDDGNLLAAESQLKSALPVLQKNPVYSVLIPQILYGLSIVARMRGDLEEADRLSKQAKGLTEQSFGPDSPSRADVISEEADLAEANAEPKRALPLRREALRIGEKTFGKDDLRSIHYERKLVSLLLLLGEYLEAGTRLDHIEGNETAKLAANNVFTAETLNLRGRLEEIRGNLVKAEVLERKSLKLFRSQYPGDHGEVADSMETLGVLLLRRGDLSSALPLLTDAYQMRLRILDPRDPGIAFSLISLAMWHQRNGDLANSNSLLQKALSNLPVDPRIARSIAALANTLLALNALSEEKPGDADRYLKQVGDFTSEVFGNNNEVAGEAARNLGVFMLEKGEFAKADMYLRQALDIFLRFSPYSAETARTAMALGISMLTRGDPAGAESILTETISRMEKGSDPSILDAALRFGLAAALLAEGKPEAAEAEMQSAFAITDHTQEKNYGLLADFLYQLGNLRLNAGDRLNAEMFWARAEDTARREVDPNHPVVAYVREARALLLAEGSLADKAHAVALASEAVQVLADRLGGDHPLTADALGVQAEVEWTAGHIDAARSALEKRAHAESTNFTRELVLNNEAGYRHLLTSQSPTDLYVSFHWNAAPNDSAAAKLAFEATLQRKGTLQDVLAEHARLEHQAGEGARLFARWNKAEDAMRACGTARSPAGLASASPDSGSECSAGVLVLAAESNRAYKALIEKVPGFNPRPVVLAELAARLHALGDYTLVEIVEYESGRPGSDSTPMRYAAYMLFSDGRFSWADLGEQAVVDSAVSKLRALQSNKHSNLKEARDAARELDHLVMEPVRQKLNGQTKLFVASDGDLNLIDFSSLVDEHGDELIEKYNIAGLTSGRDLVRLEQRPALQPKGDYLFTNPSFLASIQDISVTKQSAESGSLGAAPVGVNNTCEKEFLEYDWPAVEFHGVEMWAKAMHSTLFYEGEKANRSRLFEIENPRTIWFITHGFFCENSDGDNKAPAQASSVWRNPMGRAAIVLAGASSSNPEGRRKGYVTAEEIAELNWLGTEMVVLGACETALGASSPGDGVYGLRRALVLAGVRSQVMTLWKVDSTQTSDLLQDFAARLATGEERLASLRKSRQNIRKSNPHPYYWAGIYFMGDPGKMSGF